MSLIIFTSVLLLYCAPFLLLHYVLLFANERRVWSGPHATITRSSHGLTEKSDKMQLEALPVEVISKICRLLGRRYFRGPDKGIYVRYHNRDFQALRTTCRVRATIT